MNIKDYEFNIGDKVITIYGETGKISNICRCSKCAERGFYEPVWVDDDDFYEDYITISEAEHGFNGFYQIGKYRFNNFDKNEILRCIASHERELNRLRKQLSVMEEFEQV